MISLHIYELMDSKTLERRRTAADGFNAALTHFGMDPDEVLVEQASGYKVIFKYHDNRYVITDLGFE